MDQFYTIVRPEDFRPKITYRDRIIMIGSCFAEQVSRKLEIHKYSVLTNPFGILYNPASLSTSIERIVSKKKYVSGDLVSQDGLHHSMDHHGLFSGVDEEKVLEGINTAIEQSHSFLKNTKFVFISLGTASVFEYKHSNRIVGNCHKIPQNQFEKYTLSVEKCVKEMESMFINIRQFSPNAHILWTISPVRYLREGIIENQRNKATLIIAVREFLKHHQDSGYFPAYEIMMDQLRDYRFYASDMVHPSTSAIEIIWDHFRDVYVDHEECNHHALIEKIYKASNHRFLHESTQGKAAFARSQLKAITDINVLFPDLDFKAEQQYFFEMTEPD